MPGSNRFVSALVPILACFYLVGAQPNPAQQKRIAAAIKTAANQSNPDYTAFVNPFIGTGEPTYCQTMSGYRCTDAL